MSDLVGNPEDRFSRVAAHIMKTAACFFLCSQMSLVIKKLYFCLCNNKDADQLCSTAQLISMFVFTTPIVQFLVF